MGHAELDRDIADWSCGGGMESHLDHKIKQNKNIHHILIILYSKSQNETEINKKKKKMLCV